MINNLTLSTRFILDTLKDRDKDNLMCATQIYKAWSTYRSSLRGFTQKMQQLLNLIECAKYVYLTRKREDSDVDSQ